MTGHNYLLVCVGLGSNRSTYIYVHNIKTSIMTIICVSLDVNPCYRSAIRCFLYDFGGCFALTNKKSGDREP